MTEYSQKIRVNRVQEPKVRVRVKPRVPPLEIELRNTGTEIEWRVGTTGTWQTLVEIDDIDASISIGTVTTLAPGASATVTNVGTAQDVILNFGLPAGFDGQVVDITGTGLTIDSTNPAHPVLTISAATVPFTPTGAIAAVTVQAAIAELDSEKQPLDADLTAIAALSTTSFGRAVLALAGATALATYAGVGTGDSPQFTAVNIGAATDTTVTRSAAGLIAVEGENIYAAKLVAVFTAQSNQPPTSNFATLDTRNSHPVLDFDTTTQETAIFGGALPSNYKGNGLTVTIRAALTSAITGTLGWDVAFERDDTSLDLDADSFATAKTATAATVPGTSGATMLHTVSFSNSEIDGLLAGEPFRVRVRRDVANDTAAGDAELLRVTVEMS